MTYSVQVIDSRSNGGRDRGEMLGPFSRAHADEVCGRINEMCGPCRYARVVPDTRPLSGYQNGN
jgi:hypothetical protein